MWNFEKLNFKLQKWITEIKKFQGFEWIKLTNKISQSQKIDQRISVRILKQANWIILRGYVN